MLNLVFVKPDKSFRRYKDYLVTITTGGLINFNASLYKKIDFDVQQYCTIGIEEGNPKNKRLYFVLHTKRKKDSVGIFTHKDTGGKYISTTSPLHKLEEKGYLDGYKKKLIHYSVEISEFQGDTLLILTRIND